MDAEILQGFIRQAEEYLPSIRGGILVCARAGNIYGEMHASLRQIDAIKNAASIIDLTEIVKICEEFEETLKTARLSKEPLGDEQARRLLDKLAELEAAVTGLYFDDGFSENLSGFVEDSFEKFKTSGNEKYSDEAGDAGENFEIDDEMLEVFALEADELLRNIKTNLEKLAKLPTEREALLEIRRSSHTLKGSAAIVGLKRLSRIAHRVEDLLDYLAERETCRDARIFKLLLTSIDCFEALARDEKSPRIEKKISRAYENFDAIITLLQSCAAPEIKPDENEIAPSVLEETAKDSIPNVSVQNCSVVRVSLEKLDDLVKLVGDLTAGRSVFEQCLAEFERRITPEPRSTAKPKTDFEVRKPKSLGFYQPAGAETKHDNLSASKNFQEFDLLELGSYSEFDRTTPENHGTTGDDITVDSGLDLLKDNLESLFDNQRRLIEEMRDKLLRLRMISFGSLSGRLQRTVRVACDEDEKSAELRIEGENLEIDTQVLDCLIEPLLHLLRNAVAHGIEAPELRRLLGKPERGTISLRVSTEKTHIVVRVSDDGRGISIDALKEKAVGNNFISRDEAAKMNEAEAFELVFLPGLTTAEKLSQISGRGVGMNIVKTNIERHQGAVSVSSEAQKGTTFTLRVPNALTVARAVLVKAGGRVFAFPLNLVRHIGKIPADEFSAEREKSLRLGDENYALSHLDELLEMPVKAFAEHERVPVLFLKTMEPPSAVAVDKILRTEEIVIKQPENSSPNKPELLGSAICGDGSIVPVLDLIYLLKNRTKDASKKTAVKSEDVNLLAARQSSGDSQRLFVMIVDDSASVRLAASDLMKHAGWQPIVAENGVDALEILQSAPRLPDIILTDAEMPRMDGYEFLAVLKRQRDLSRIPVVMITSRTGDEYQQKAVDAGVSEYLTKPFEDKNLINTIKNLIKV